MPAFKRCPKIAKSQLAAKETVKETVFVANGIITTFFGAILALVVGVELAIFGIIVLFTIPLNPRIHQRRHKVLGGFFYAVKTKFGTVVIPGIFS